MSNGRARGQITLKGPGKFLVRIFIGRDEAGKRLYESKVINGSAADAKRYLRERQVRKDRGQLVLPSRTSLGEYLDMWLDTTVRGRVRETTYDSYKYHLSRYVTSELKSSQLQKLKTDRIQSWVTSLRQQSYSPRTIEYVHTILKNALKKAVQSKMIEANPCEFVELPKKRRSTPRIFNREEAQAFLKAAQSNKHGLIFEFGLITGARPEEYLAIQWSDLEMDRGAISFQRTLIWRKGGGWYFDDQMKTALSRRTILLPEPLLVKLKAHRLDQAKTMMRLGTSYQRNDLVFASDEGTPLNSGNLTKRYYQKILKAAQLDHRTLYSLRHSCATLLLAEGINIKVIQERLGHSDITLTLSTYSHVLDGMQADASSKMGSLLYQTRAS